MTEQILNVDGLRLPDEEIIESYSCELAIDDLLKNKTHPDSFELLDIKLLGE